MREATRKRIGQLNKDLIIVTNHMGRYKRSDKTHKALSILEGLIIESIYIVEGKNG